MTFERIILVEGEGSQWQKVMEKSSGTSVEKLFMRQRKEANGEGNGGQGRQREAASLIKERKAP